MRITKKALKMSMGDIKAKTGFRLVEKGEGSFSSPHELLGIITEEYQEFIEAVKSNNSIDIQKELLDIAVACNFGLACYKQGALSSKL